VLSNDLVDSDIAYKVTSNKYEVRGNHPMGVDVAHRVAWRKSFLRGGDRYNLQTRAGLGPLGFSIARLGRNACKEDDIW
jgi:hypothetical protein